MNSIKTFRDFYCMSQRQLANKIGISHAEINFIETEQRIPNVFIAIRLAKALNTQVEILFVEDEIQEKT